MLGFATIYNAHSSAPSPPRPQSLRHKLRSSCRFFGLTTHAGLYISSALVGEVEKCESALEYIRLQLNTLASKCLLHRPLDVLGDKGGRVSWLCARLVDTTFD